MKITIDTLDIDWFEPDKGALIKKVDDELGFETYFKITFEIIDDEEF